MLWFRYSVRYEDGDEEEGVTAARLRAPGGGAEAEPEVSDEVETGTAVEVCPKDDGSGWAPGDAVEAMTGKKKGMQGKLVACAPTTDISCV